MPFSPPGKGFLTGTLRAETPLGPKDFRSTLPRFTPAAMTANQALGDMIRALGASRGATPAHVALGWVLARGPCIAPFPGTTKLARIEKTLARRTLP